LKKRRIRMRRLITICLVVGLTLISTCVSWATPIEPNVTPPPGAPGWWNVACPNYAYAWWEADITSPASDVSPLGDATHWASNFLNNTDFTASVDGTTVSIDLTNVPNSDPWYKEIYIYLDGIATGNVPPQQGTFDVDGTSFSGSQSSSIDQGTGLWTYLVNGEIHPQPPYANLSFTVPGLISVTNIWAGENCVPEPATIGLLGLGVLSLIRRKR
jgi:hypothetical protein